MQGGFGARSRSLGVLLFMLAGTVFAAPDSDARDLVRRAIEADDLRPSDPALLYKFDEHYVLRDLAPDGRAVSSKSRIRPMPMADFMRRRERFRKPMREIPDAFVFTMAPEETVLSRRCYVVDAAPRPGYRPVDRYSKLFTQVKGRLWIDKDTGRWVKLEAELLDTVTFGWILVRIHKGARVRMTQRPVDQDAWLPDELWYRVSLRIGLVSLRFQESETRYSGYTREPADSEESSGGPGRSRFQPAFALAQSTSRRTPGKYSLRISSPGIPKIHP